MEGKPHEGKNYFITYPQMLEQRHIDVRLMVILGVSGLSLLVATVIRLQTILDYLNVRML